MPDKGVRSLLESNETGSPPVGEHPAAGQINLYLGLDAELPQKRLRYRRGTVGQRFRPPR